MLDKEQASQAPLCSVISARSAGNYGSFCGFKNGVNIRAVISSLRSLSPNAYSHKEKTGVTPRKKTIMGKKEKFPLYLSPEKRPFWSAGIRRTGAGASPTSLSGRWTFIWTTSAPTTLDCFSLPPSSPIWTACWTSSKAGCPLCCTSKRWSRIWWLVSSPTHISSAARSCADGGRRASKMCGRPMAASRWSTGCGRLGRMGMNGKTDRQKSVYQVRR